jgi:hypothetical protein
VVELLIRLTAESVAEKGLSTILADGEVLELRRADQLAERPALNMPLSRLVASRALASVQDEKLRSILTKASNLALLKDDGKIWAGEFVAFIESHLMEACGQVRWTTTRIVHTYIPPHTHTQTQTETYVLSFRVGRAQA